nr:immunoglobulin heavy chain junction region [Mus musculus]
CARNYYGSWFAYW